MQTQGEALVSEVECFEFEFVLITIVVSESHDVCTHRPALSWKDVSRNALEYIQLIDIRKLGSECVRTNEMAAWIGRIIFG